jgi:hypothetical protein
MPAKSTRFGKINRHPRTVKKDNGLVLVLQGER